MILFNLKSLKTLYISNNFSLSLFLIKSKPTYIWFIFYLKIQHISC